MNSLALALGVSLEWLRTGEGEMLPPAVDLTSWEKSVRDQVAETVSPYEPRPDIDVRLLEEIIRQTLAFAPRQTPEVQAKAISDTYSSVIHSRRSDKIPELIKTFLS